VVRTVTNVVRTMARQLTNTKLRNQQKTKVLETRKSTVKMGGRCILSPGVSLDTRAVPSASEVTEAYLHVGAQSSADLSNTCVSVLLIMSYHIKLVLFAIA